jgi:hypothetical protein
MAVNTVSTASPVQWQLITSTTISGTPTSVTFNSFSGYQTLLLTSRSVGTTSGGTLLLTVNGDSTAGSYTYSAGVLPYNQIGAGYTANQAVYAIISDVDKTIPHRIEAKATNNTNWAADYYTNPVVITSITVTANTDTFSAGTFYLYGIPS